MPDVDIAIPLFNCGPWLDAMFESIVEQAEPDWRIVARDDGSRDDTAERLETWRKRLDRQILVLDNHEKRNLGLVNSYNTVLNATNARWVLTADPDDIWLPGHLALVVEALRRTESQQGAGTPVAVCTDAAVIDEHGNPIADSYWRWTHSDPGRTRSVIEIAMESPLLGSTMGVNRALLDTALPIATNAVGQDWWLALAAAAFGTVVALPDISVLYRRHTTNNSGYPMISSLMNTFGNSILTSGAARERLKRVLFQEASPQAAAFVERFCASLPSRDAEALAALGKLGSRGPLSRRVSLLRHGLGFASPIKNCGMFVLC